MPISTYEEEHAKQKSAEKQFSSDTIATKLAGFRTLVHEVQDYQEKDNTRESDTAINWLQSTAKNSSFKPVIAALEKGAKENNKEDQYLLGVIYEHGIGIKKPDPKQAAFYYENAAQQALPSAQYRLAKLRLSNPAVPNNDPEATVVLLNTATTGGCTQAQNLMGTAATALSKHYEQRNQPEANRLAAEALRVEKAVFSPRYNQRGVRTFNDVYKLAVEHLQQNRPALAAFHFESAFNHNIGRFDRLYNSQTPELVQVEKFLAAQAQEGKEWAKKALPTIQHSLGGKFSSEHGDVTQDNKRAFNYYLKAALQGNTQSHQAVAECYLLGRGVKASPEKVVKFYEEAIERQQRGARYLTMDRLAGTYAEGAGCMPKDLGKAIEWYQKAQEDEKSVSSCRMVTIAECHLENNDPRQWFTVMRGAAMIETEEERQSIYFRGGAIGLLMHNQNKALQQFAANIGQALSDDPTVRAAVAEGIVKSAMNQNLKTECVISTQHDAALMANIQRAIHDIGNDPKALREATKRAVESYARAPRAVGAQVAVASSSQASSEGLQQPLIPKQQEMNSSASSVASDSWKQQCRDILTYAADGQSAKVQQILNNVPGATEAEKENNRILLVNTRDGKNRTPLRLASKKENHNTVGILLDNGANPYLMDYRNNRINVSTSLWDSKFSTIRRSFITQWNTDHAAFKAKDANDQQPLQIPPLIIAIVNGDGQKVSDLLRAGVDPNQRYGGLTALMVAGMQERPLAPTIIKDLLGYGANPLLKDGTEGLTAAGIARAKSDKESLSIDHQSIRATARTLEATEQNARQFMHDHPGAKHDILKQQQVESYKKQFGSALAVQAASSSSQPQQQSQPRQQSVQAQPTAGNNPSPKAATSVAARDDANRQSHAAASSQALPPPSPKRPSAETLQQMGMGSSSSSQAVRADNAATPGSRTIHMSGQSYENVAALLKIQKPSSSPSFKETSDGNNFDGRNGTRVFDSTQWIAANPSLASGAMMFTEAQETKRAANQVKWTYKDGQVVAIDHGSETSALSHVNGNIVQANQGKIEQLTQKGAAAVSVNVDGKVAQPTVNVSSQQQAASAAHSSQGFVGRNATPPPNPSSQSHGR